jgi:hypothetical protein
MHMSIHAKFVFISAAAALATCTVMFVSSMRAKAADEAVAGTTPGVESTLDVATEACTTTFLDNSNPGFPVTFHYAQHAYPSKSTARLSQVQVIGHVAPSVTGLNSLTLPGDYEWAHPDLGPASILVKYGAVAVECGYTQTDSTGGIINSQSDFDRVTFTLVH